MISNERKHAAESVCVCAIVRDASGAHRVVTTAASYSNARKHAAECVCMHVCVFRWFWCGGGGLRYEVVVVLV